jgi:hypothetical protein
MVWVEPELGQKVKMMTLQSNSHRSNACSSLFITKLFLQFKWELCGCLIWRFAYHYGIFWRSYRLFPHRIIHDNIFTHNSSYILYGNVACLLITHTPSHIVIAIWSNFFFKELLTFCTKIFKTFFWASWSWSYGSWIYNDLCNQCISPLKSWVRTPFMARCTRLSIMVDFDLINSGYASY